MRYLTIVLLLVITSVMSNAKTYRLEGTIGGKYPIAVDLEEHYDGYFSGRYAYKTTLQKNGNGDCSWLQINPSYENPTTEWTVRDCTPDVVETWYNVKFADRKHLNATMKNNRGKIFTVSANVIESSSVSASLISHFKEHIGDCPSDFQMFTNPTIQQRWVDMMGENNFNYLVSIYQTQGGIEYTKGMYWGSAFMAHQCCDPATVWAYDSDNDKFYIWILKDDRDYWWSETGAVPLKFRELVNDKF